MTYLGMFRSTGTGLAYVNRYDGDVPGWGGLARHDRFFAADINGDGRCDLWAWNYQDWSEEYLGRMISSGTGLCRPSFIGDWVGEWNLGPADAFEVARFTRQDRSAAALRPQHRLVRCDQRPARLSASTASTTGGSTTTATAGTGEGNGHEAGQDEGHPGAAGRIPGRCRRQGQPSAQAAGRTAGLSPVPARRRHRRRARQAGHGQRSAGRR